MDARVERLDDGYAVLEGNVVLVEGIGDRTQAENLMFLAQRGAKYLAQELERLAEEASESYGWERDLMDLGVQAA